jgi:hypothetical protein
MEILNSMSGIVRIAFYLGMLKFAAAPRRATRHPYPYPPSLWLLLLLWLLLVSSRVRLSIKNFVNRKPMFIQDNNRKVATMLNKPVRCDCGMEDWIDRVQDRITT